MSRAEKIADAFAYLQQMQPTKTDLSTFTPQEMQRLSAGAEAAIARLQSMQADIAEAGGTPMTTATEAASKVSRAQFEAMGHKERYELMANGGRVID